MKRTYRLDIEGKNRDRLLDAARHDMRRYAKRERSRPLPEGVDFWDFTCRFGASEETAADVQFKDLNSLVDAAAKEGAPQFYVEIVTGHGKRAVRPEAGPDEDLLED
ncbi:MAG: hypothetical protein EOO28_01075 [Comamonadaceae bacterium]|nr:MAG: hypothetical protein EOO28_01075 [Comamonadaceae bacterium]